MHTNPVQIDSAGRIVLPPLNATNCNLYVTPECIRSEFSVTVPNELWYMS